VKTVRPAAAELGLAQVKHASEHGSDPSARPSDLILDLSEWTRPVGRGRKRVEQRAHQLAATVVEALDLVDVLHRVVRRVFGQPPATHDR
jgi:hypothetical protein